jgi:hypothetical protein
LNLSFVAAFTTDLEPSKSAEQLEKTLASDSRLVKIPFHDKPSVDHILSKLLPRDGFPMQHQLKPSTACQAKECGIYIYATERTDEEDQRFNPASRSVERSAA